MLSEKQFGALFRALHARLTAYAHRVFDPMYADDAAQLAWIEAWKRRAEIVPDTLWGWLCRVVRQKHWQILNRFRGSRSQNSGEHTSWETLIAEDGLPLDMADSGAQEASAERSMLYRSLANMKLPPRSRESLRETMVLVAQTGSVLEAAQARGVSEQGARVLYNRGIEALREQWGLT